MKQKGSVCAVLLIFSILTSGFISISQTEKKESFITGCFRTITPGIYVFKDICNVYILKSGNSALLIDAGSGNITHYLNEIGVDKVEWVLHTHYHRDQCIGSFDLKKSGAKTAIGEPEADLLNRDEVTAPFKLPETILLNGELPGWGKRLAPFESPGVDKKLIDGEEFIWKQYKIKVINTPGHTEGSVSYFIEVDGKKLCFTGDLIMKGGYIRDFYSMQWIYLQNPGIEASIASLAKLSEIHPDLLLPSHGEIMDSPTEDIKMLNFRLKKTNELLTFKRAGRWNWSQFVQISEHVIQDGGSTSQIVVSDSGEALLFDCGPGFLQKRLPEAKAKFGIKHIDVIIPSHWHYDHVDGINEVAEAEGAKVWVWEGLTEHLEYPEHFPTTCWSGKSIKVDRILKADEEFEWGGYSFKVYHHPVHMEQQMGLYAKVDRLDLYMMGDGIGHSKDGHIRCSIHCYNGISLSSGLIKTAQSFCKANPYICLQAHSNVFAISPSDKDEFLNWAIETTDALRSLLPPPLPDLGYDPYWATFYPSRIHLQAGEKTEIMLRLKNYTNRTISGKYQLKGYGNIIFEKKLVEYELKPGETKDLPVVVKSKITAKNGIHIVTADIEYDNHVFGEYPQAYIEIDE